MPAIADNGSDVDGWFVILVVAVVVVVWIVVEIRTIRQERPAFTRVDRPLVERIPDELPVRPRFCSYIGCDEDPVVAVNGWLVCQTHRPPTAVTTKPKPTKEIPVDHPTPVQIDVSGDGSLVTVQREDLPAVADRDRFAATMTYDQLEDTYVRARARRLGMNAAGDL